MNKKLASAAMAATMLGGAGFGALAMMPLAATAEDSAIEQPADGQQQSPDQWMSNALQGLVDNNTINAEQRDAVVTALNDARPDGDQGPGGPDRHGGPMRFEAAASALGIDEATLRTELQSGKTLAAVAQEKGVDVQKVVDALVAESNKRIDEQVASGKLTQEKADERKAKTVERVTQMVNSAPPARGPEGRGGPGGAGPDQAPPANASTAPTA